MPTGFQSKELIVKAGLNLGDVDQFPNIDVTIDGADEVDVSDPSRTPRSHKLGSTRLKPLLTYRSFDRTTSTLSSAVPLLLWPALCD